MSIVDVANVMARTEDYSWNPSTMSWSVPNPNSLAQANNNPANLWYVGQPGATKGKGGFAKFDTPEAGFQAELNQIQLDAGRGLSFSAFLEKMTPKAQNPNFDQNVPASRLGVKLTDKLSDIIGSSPSSTVDDSNNADSSGSFDITSVIGDEIPGDYSDGVIIGLLAVGVVGYLALSS